MSHPSFVKPALISILLLTAALLLRFHDIDRVSVWLDEDAQGQVGLRYAPWRAVPIFKEAARQDQPPTDYFLASIAVRLIGKSAFVIRFFPALLGSAAVVVFFWAALAASGSLFAALLGGAILLFNPFLLIYSHEARPYSLAIFAECCFLLALALAIRRGRGFHWVAVAAVFFLMSVSLQPEIILAALPIGFLVAQYLSGIRLVTRPLCMAIAAALLVAFVPLVLILKFSPYPVPHARPAFDLAALSDQIVSTGRMMAGLWAIQSRPAAILCITAFLLLGTRAVRREKPHQNDALFLACAIALPLLPLFVQALFLLRSDRSLQPRYLLAAVPLFALVTALAAAILERAAKPIPRMEWAVRAAILGVAVFFAFQLNSIHDDAYTKAYIYHDDWRGVYTLFRAPENAGSVAYVWTLPEKEAWTPHGMIAADFYYPDSQPRPVAIHSLWDGAWNGTQADDMLDDIRSGRRPTYIFLVTPKAWNQTDLAVDRLPPDLEAREWQLCNIRVVRIKNVGSLAKTLLKYFSAYRHDELPAAAREKMDTTIRRMSPFD